MALLSVYTVQPERMEAGIVFSRFRLAAGVNIPGYPQAGAGTNNVGFPLDINQYGSAHNSSVSGHYLASFDGSALDLTATLSLACEGVASPNIAQCSTTSDIRFTTSVPLIASVHVQFDFLMPPGDRELLLSVTLAAATTTYYHDGAGYMPIFGDPSSGSWESQADSIYLPANVTYAFGYSFIYFSFGGSSNQTSQGIGNVSFHFEPVPEPSSLCLLTLGLSVLTHRRRQR